MSSKTEKGGNRRWNLATGASVIAAAAAALSATPAVAQDAGEEEEAIVVTGSRIVRQDYVANSPITTVSAENLVGNADITVETYLNTLPQVNPAGTTTSNNPGNGGQANIDLRGLGSNRNLVLIDGRRPVVSASDMTVDVNIIPQAMIERVEVITGGAGATYGADAISGAVNFILRDNFEGADFRASYQNSTEYWDAAEWSASALFGANFADGRGNAVFSFDHAFREYLTKGQRPFSQFATSTTPTAPEGSLRWNTSTANGETTNPIPFSAVQNLFASYGIPNCAPAPGACTSVTAQSGLLGFNLDGSLFYGGIYNSPLNVQNYTDPPSLNVNQRYFPDFYSYNFDPLNALVVPYERDSFMGRLNYDLGGGIEVFGQATWTEYTSGQNLAPVPTPTVLTAAPNACTAIQVCSSLVAPGKNVGRNIIVPVTNPFIPADLATLLAARTGDDSRIVGSGATEPFLIGFRPTAFGPRQNNFENTAVQFLTGFHGPIGDTGWTFDVYASEGRVEIDNNQTGNIDTQRLTDVLAAPGGTLNGCAYNPFGAQPVSAACVAYLSVPTSTSTEFRQQIGQGYVTGPLGELPAGPVEAVVGVEYRAFEYFYNAGPSAGPISGFNNGTNDRGNNSFLDLFAEMLVPLANNLELNLGYRRSHSEFEDEINAVGADLGGADAYKAELSWQVADALRLRLSYQRSVRAPNFGELFSGGSSAPQIFDPCSVNSGARLGSDGVAGGAGSAADGANAASIAALCQATGVSAANLATFIGTPAVQTTIVFEGNTNLSPETGDTITAGLTFESPWNIPFLPNLRGAIDYYSIEVMDAIQAPDVNVLIAGCYNYYGTNPGFSAANAACNFRRSPDIAYFLPGVETDTGFQGANYGSVETSGVDIQLDWGYDLGDYGDLRFNVVGTKLLEYFVDDTPGQPGHDYAGTVAFFGAGLGQSFPEYRVTLQSGWDVGRFGFNLRGRYIHEMENRNEVIFPGEWQFTGTDSVWYWDVIGSMDLTDNVEFRLGVNNVADEQPQEYFPNVQSGTDPSLYDVIGRRVVGQLNMRF